MVRYLTRTCPRCYGHVGIILQEPGSNTRLQAVNGHCLRCAYRLSWIVIRGNRPSRPRLSRKHERGRWIPDQGAS